MVLALLIIPDGGVMRTSLCQVTPFEPATLPPELRTALHAQVQADPPLLRREDILHALTDIRRQTAVDAQTGAPEAGSLRAMRVLLHDTPLIARLDCDTAPDKATLALLAACVLAVRRGGTGRNRGRGRLQMLVHPALPTDYADTTFTQTHFQRFADLVRAHS